MMKYRDIEYTVVQGIGRHLWKWSASVADVVITGQAHSKSAAVVEAEKAIDRALALKKGATCATQGGNEYALAICYSPLNGKPRLRA
ncbi:hypothetical protein [Bradyrhizobium sp. AZCC 2289]|uniref:hypothetical protein n=1 Tax=Bradyrhizobium sp. AZCC 2289 TaxID=3117026 RepID=UPI002FEFC953